MSADDFQILCSAFYATYEPLIRIWSASLAGAGALVGVVMGIIMLIRRAFMNAP